MQGLKYKFTPWIFGFGLLAISSYIFLYLFVIVIVWQINTNIFLSSSSKTLDKSGCVVDYNSIPTGWCQYLQLGYIVLCTSVNKTIIIIVTTTTTIIIIIIIIIVIKTGAPLLGLAKYIYYFFDEADFDTVAHSHAVTTDIKRTKTECKAGTTAKGWFIIGQYFG